MDECFQAHPVVEFQDKLGARVVFSPGRFLCKPPASALVLEFQEHSLNSPQAASKQTALIFVVVVVVVVAAAAAAICVFALLLPSRSVPSR